MATKKKKKRKPAKKNARKAPKKSPKNKRNRGGSGRKATKRTSKAKGRSNGKKNPSKYEIQRGAYRVTDGDYAYDGFTAEQWHKIGKHSIAAALEDLDRKGRKPSKRKPKQNKRKNPGRALKSKISQMKPNTWYPSTLSGAKVKVKRSGSKLVIMPAKKRRAS